jgi:hypothetical protein
MWAAFQGFIHKFVPPGAPSEVGTHRERRLPYNCFLNVRFCSNPVKRILYVPFCDINGDSLEFQDCLAFPMISAGTTCVSITHQTFVILDSKNIVSAVCIHPRQFSSGTTFSLSLFSLLSPCRLKEKATLVDRVATSYRLPRTPLKWKFRGAEAWGERCIYYQGMRN